MGADLSGLSTLIQSGSLMSYPPKRFKTMAWGSELNLTFLEFIMTWLSLLLLVKIIGSVLFLVLPLLFLSKEKLEKALLVQAQTPQLFRLYGMAILALLVGYSFGVSAAESETFPWGVVFMGIVSNGGAALILLFSAGSKTNRISLIVFGLIALGLVFSALYPDWVLKSAW